MEQNGINGIENETIEKEACGVTMVFWNLVDKLCNKVPELSDKSGVAQSTIRNYLERKAIPRLDVANKVLNAIGYEITIKKKVVDMKRKRGKKP